VFSSFRLDSLVGATAKPMHSLLHLVLIGAVVGCVSPDCHRPDCGTCSVACCVLLVEVAAAEAQLMQALNGSLAKGGPDGRFILKPTAESPYGSSLCPVAVAFGQQSSSLPFLLPTPQALETCGAITRRT